MPRMPPSTTRSPGTSRPRRPPDTGPAGDGTRAVVDGVGTGSVSFAPSDGPDPRSVTRPVPSQWVEGHAFIAVGPGLPGARLRAGLVTSYPFPITGTKIHPPLLRSDTLSRPRLNDWMDAAVRGRVVLVVAEAGFGKTTMLADWASLAERRTAWYRLEPDDSDWLTFLRHLVASGRELDPDFAAETLELLLALGTGGPKKPDIIATLVREYADFAASLPTGLTLILDDQHVIDESAETQAILRALVDRTGDGFSIVIASRSVPSLALGRLRSRGGLARLDGEDLCFDVPETDRLFREAYNRPLDLDIVEELTKRTDGWAALLTLVRTSLEDKDAPEARALVAQLSATRGDLYDFLAEEVLASLSPALQHFLTRVAVLVSVDAETGSLVDDRPPDEIGVLIAESEALGLLSRPDRGAAHRFHPLVRDFLLERLTLEIGTPAVRDLHHRVAKALEGTDWFASAWHYREAAEPDSAARVIDAAVPGILAAGAFELAAPFLDGSAGPIDRPRALLLRSRVDMERGSAERAVDLARSALERADPEFRSTALLNLAFMQSINGFGEGFVELASAALQGPLTPEQADLANAAILVAGSQGEGDLEDVVHQLTELAARQDQQGHRRYAGITRLNLALVSIWLGRLDDARSYATAAELALGSSPSSVFTIAAMVARAHALMRLGMIPEAIRASTEALSSPISAARDEAALEMGSMFVDFGAIETAEATLASTGSVEPVSQYQHLQALPYGFLALRRGDVDRAAALSRQLGSRPYSDIAGKLRTQILLVRVLVAQGSSTAEQELRELDRVARVQRSRVGIGLSRILTAVLNQGRIGPEIESLMAIDSYLLSMVAEELSACLHRTEASALERIYREATLRPDRWRTALRLAIAREDASEGSAARLLAAIGNRDDAALLRDLGKSRGVVKPYAVAITRRLAEPVYVQDLGSVAVFLGSHRVGGRPRRKVIALLCFLSSRAGMSATRDEALEALWPELGPDTAVNSLHQTIYFLRRIFEPDYREGLSAGYVGFDGEVVSLDRELVDTASRHAWRLIEAGGSPTPASAHQLLDRYVHRYALEFAYEEWAVPYRDTLHAAVLGYVEQAIERADGAEIGIQLARRVLAIDPTADTIELGLLRAYKRGGLHAAAAEQYAHYSTVMRAELGIEPPPLDDL